MKYEHSLVQFNTRMQFRMSSKRCQSTEDLATDFTGQIHVFVMDLFVHLKVFEAHEFLVADITFVFMPLRLLPSVDAHVLNEVGTKTYDATAYLTFVGFAA